MGCVVVGWRSSVRAFRVVGLWSYPVHSIVVVVGEVVVGGIVGGKVVVDGRGMDGINVAIEAATRVVAAVGAVASVAEIVGSAMWVAWWGRWNGVVLLEDLAPGLGVVVEKITGEGSTDEVPTVFGAVR